MVPQFAFILLFTFFSAQEKSDTTTIRKIEENLDLAQNNYYKAPELAGYYANEAVREAIKIQNDSLEIEALILLGTSYIHQSRFDMALDIYYQALDKEDRCSPATIAYLHACLGNSYRLLRNFKRATEFLDKSALYYKDFPNDPRESYYHNIKGLLHFVQKEYKQAEKEFNYALQINRRFNNSKAIAANLNNLGMLPEHFQEKIKFLEEALQINLAVNATWAIAENYNNFGLQHLYAGKYKKALDYLEKAREKAKTINAQEILMDNLNYCAQIYHKIGDMANAYESLQQLHQLEKQIFITDRISNIERRIAEKKLKESEQQVRIEQKQNQLQTIQKRYLLGISALLLTTLLIIIFQVRVRQKIKIQKLAVEQELHEKNNALINYQLNAVEIEKNNAFTALDYSKKLLTNLCCYIKSRNDLFQKIITMLKEAKKMHNEELKTQLEKISSFIALYLKSNSNLKDTLLQIETLHSDFTERLMQKHGNLTKGDQKLATYLRIGLSNKDISILTDNPPNTINIARYRLRQHLNLQPKESLTEYIRKI